MPIEAALERNAIGGQDAADCNEPDVETVLSLLRSVFAAPPRSVLTCFLGAIGNVPERVVS
jgi:hypothetical protein